MKLTTLLLSLLIACASFCQAALTQEQKDDAAKALTPIEGKAIVYILRPSSFGALVKMNLECDSVHIGATQASRYVYTVVDAGTHTFVSKSENKNSLSMKLEGGKIYYLKQQVKMGLVIAETKLELLDDDEGKKDLKKCKLSKDNVYTN